MAGARRPAIGCDARVVVSAVTHFEVTVESLILSDYCSIRCCLITCSVLYMFAFKYECSELLILFSLCCEEFDYCFI